jgi:hypothetical protein
MARLTLTTTFVAAASVAAFGLSAPAFAGAVDVRAAVLAELNDAGLTARIAADLDRAAGEGRRGTTTFVAAASVAAFGLSAPAFAGGPIKIGSYPGGQTPG